jgi:hypothetical protein
VTVQERRREGRKNDTNVIRIVSKEWTLWLTRRGRSNGPQAAALIGFKKANPTDKTDKTKPSHTPQTVIAARGQQAALAVHKGKRLRHGGGN